MKHRKGLDPIPFPSRRMAQGASSILVLQGLTLLLALTACAPTLSVEPGAIIVRNATPVVLDYLEIRENAPENSVISRIGRFNGVPPHSDQYIQRRNEAPPLPVELVVQWRTRRGISHSQIVKPHLALEGLRIDRDTALVIQIDQGGRVSVYVTDS